MLKLNKKTIYFGAILALILFSFSPIQSAKALSLMDIAPDVVISKVLNFSITNFLAPIVKWIIILFINLIRFAININYQLFGIGNNSFVVKGWSTVRDIANLGFVLAIIVIAFATILRIDAYGIKKTLARLIIVALLVNFSLMICAGIFDLANVFSNALINEDTISSEKFGDSIKAAIGIDEFINSKPKDFAPDLEKETTETTETENSPGALLAGLFTPLFITIFSVILVITLAGIFIMFLIRYVVLGVLIILSPLAWLCYILPNTKTYWDQWWKFFLRWILFAPIMFFFIWLALFAGAGNNSRLDYTPTVNTSFGAALASGLGNMIIVLGILLMGLFVANSLGITGASTFKNLAMGSAAGIGGFIGSRAASRTLQTGWAQKLAGGLQKAGYGRGTGVGGNFARWATTPLRQAGTGLRQAHTQLAGRLAETTEKSFEKLDTDKLVGYARRGNAEEMMGAFNVLDKKGKLTKLSSDELQHIQHAASRFGQDEKIKKAIEKQAPHLSQEVASLIKQNNPIGAQNKLNELISKISPKDLPETDFGHMFKNPDTKNIAAGAILDASKESLDTLISAYKNTNHEDRMAMHKTLQLKISIDPDKHKDFKDLAGRSKNLLIKNLAGEKQNA